MGDDPDLKVALWNPWVETFEAADDFCCNCVRLRNIAPGQTRYRCLGHVSSDEPRPESRRAGDPEPSAVEFMPDPAEEEREEVGRRKMASRHSRSLEDLQSSLPVVLELGCGTGRFSKAFDDSEVNAVGVDRGGVYRPEIRPLYLDLSEPDAQQVLLDAVAAGHVKHVHCSGPSPTLHKVRLRKRAKGKPPRVLRSVDSPLGIVERDEDHPEGLTRVERYRVSKDNSVIFFYRTLIQKCEEM